MTEQTPAPAGTTPAPAGEQQQQAQTTPQQGDPDGLGEAGRRAIAAERATAAEATRQLREAQTQLAGMQGRITELETNLGTLTTERDTATGDALRYRVALENGVPPVLAGRLQGADEAALIADATQLLGSLPTPTQPTTKTPRPDPSQGSRTPATSSPQAEFARWLQGQSSTT